MKVHLLPSIHHELTKTISHQRPFGLLKHALARLIFRHGYSNTTYIKGKTHDYHEFVHFRSDVCKDLLQAPLRLMNVYHLRLLGMHNIANYDKTTLRARAAFRSYLSREYAGAEKTQASEALKIRLKQHSRVQRLNHE